MHLTADQVLSHFSLTARSERHVSDDRRMGHPYASAHLFQNSRSTTG